jgi:cell division protein FtsB
MPERLARRLARGLAAIGAVLAGYYFLLGGEYGLRDLQELKRTRAEAAVRVDSLHRWADSLAAWGDSLTTEPAVIERVARERYSFLRPGEHVYRFVDLGKDGVQEVDGQATQNLTSDSGGD